MAPRGNIMLGSCEPLFTTPLSTNQFIILFYVSFCLKTPYLIYTVESLTLNSRPTVLELMPAWCLSNTHIILCQAHHNLLSLRNTRQHFSTMFGGHFKQQNHQQRAQKCEKRGTIRARERHLFIGQESKWEGRASPSLNSTGGMCDEHLKCDSPPCESPWKLPSIDLWDYKQILASWQIHKYGIHK